MIQETAVSDFAQQGLICTLQRLNDTHLGEIEEELARIAATRRIALVLPCHAAELGRPALEAILNELSEATWLSEVVVSMNGLDEPAHEEAKRYFARLQRPFRVLWNDPHTNGKGGKGANVAAAFQLLASEKRVAMVATQDCDVASFRKVDLARLSYAVLCLGYRFAKAYYSRVTDRMYGRVSRLFLAPLLHAVVRVQGHLPLVDFLMSFRYPLSGECAMELSLVEKLPVAEGWKLEIGQLCEVFRQVDPREVCQVDGGVGYDHKHQPALTSLVDMAAQISEELIAQLEQEGLKTTAGFRQALVAAYEREAHLALQRYAALARMNAIPFDEGMERGIIGAFSERLGGTVLRT